MNTQKYYMHNSDLLRENDRSLYQRKRDGEDVVYDSQSHSKIDFERTHLNYNVCPHEQYTRDQIIQIQENIRGKKFPKNGVLFGSTVITLPKDFDGDPREFFCHAYDGLKGIYHITDDDVVSAYVHMDETSAHMHFNFIPHYENTISWEKTMPKSIYDTQHRLLEEYLNEQNIGEVHLLNGNTLGFDVQSLTPEQKTVSMEIYELKNQRDELYQKIFDLEYSRQKIEKDINYYFDEGNVEKANEATIKWEKINDELPILIQQRKAISAQLKEKTEVFSSVKNPTGTQSTIIELVADRTHLETTCWEQTLRAQETNKRLQALRGELQQTISENKIDDSTIDDLSNGFELALGHAFMLGQEAERKGLKNEELSKFKAESISKAARIMLDPLSTFKQAARSLKNRISDIIDRYNTNASKIALELTGDIEIYTGRDGRVSEKGKAYIERYIRDNLRTTDNPEWRPVRDYVRSLNSVEKQEKYIKTIVKSAVDFVEDGCSEPTKKYVHKSVLNKKIYTSAITITSNLISAVRAVQQMQEQAMEDFER